MKYKYRIVKYKQVRDNFDGRTGTYNPVVDDKYQVQRKTYSFPFSSSWEDFGWKKYDTIIEAESFVKLQILNDEADSFNEVIKNY